jgi:hypothetical protein
VPETSWKARAWLCLPPLTMALTDGATTLLGQDDRYWAGDYACAREANPLVYPLLTWHPLVFLAAAILLGIAYAFVIMCWRGRTVVLLAFLMTVGHAFGTASWLFPRGWIGIGLAVVVFVAANALLTLSWKRAGVLRQQAISNDAD